jgi:hypothetical protein
MLRKNLHCDESNTAERFGLLLCRGPDLRPVAFQSWLIKSITSAHPPNKKSVVRDKLQIQTTNSLSEVR